MRALRLMLCTAASVLIPACTSADPGNGEASTATLCYKLSPVEPFRKQSYCGWLELMSEPLEPRTRATVTEAYRLLWLRSFDPHVLVRIEFTSQAEAEMTVRVRGDVQLDRTVRLNLADVSRLRAELQRLRFWQQPSVYSVDMRFGALTVGRIAAGEQVAIADGAAWIVEGQTAVRYHVMGDNPQLAHTPPRVLGEVMLRVAQQHVPELPLEPLY